VDGSTVDELRLRACDPLARPTPRTHRVRVGDAIEGVLERALALRPDDRYGDAGDFWAALTRAAKLGRRAARVSFDWPNARETRAKVIEELQEVDEAIAQAADGAGAQAAIAEELGDLLFAVANWGRHLEVDAEGALRGANAKFERRFARMEALAGARGLALKELSAAEWDALWREAKLNRS